MMPRKETLADGIELWLGDCREVLPTLGKVDAVVTSPPYDNIRDYGEGWQGVDYLAVISCIADRLDDGGVAMWNVADQTVNGSETGTSFRQALHAMECGLRLHDTMIYCKEGVTFPDSNRYHPAFEFMFVFSKGAPKHFNGIRDWRNKWAGSKMHGTDRLADGTTKRINGHGNLVPEQGLRRNWWVIANPYIGETGGHPAPMPYRMASDHIETWTVTGETVLDPFLGSGTTGVACVQLGRKFIGIEIDPGYFDIACRRISDELKRPRLDLGEPVAKPVQEAFI
jgi:site-specific DNA-methyltransferase (adenine-specific)